MPTYIGSAAVDVLTGELEQLGTTLDLGSRGGVRDAFRPLPGVRPLAVSAPMSTLVSTVLGPHCVAVRAIVFDKTPGANSKVSRHQDVTIAVREQHDEPAMVHGRQRRASCLCILQRSSSSRC